MRGVISEGPRPNGGLEPHFLTQPRYLFLVVFHIVYPSGTHVAHRTKLYGAATQKVALIFFDSSRIRGGYRRRQITSRRARRTIILRTRQHTQDKCHFFIIKRVKIKTLGYNNG
jgi:hypothetical protein